AARPLRSLLVVDDDPGVVLDLEPVPDRPLQPLHQIPCAGVEGCVRARGAQPRVPVQLLHLRPPPGEVAEVARRRLVLPRHGGITPRGPTVSPWRRPPRRTSRQVTGRSGSPRPNASSTRRPAPRPRSPR